jgi:hypothetical protein
MLHRLFVDACYTHTLIRFLCARFFKWSEIFDDCPSTESSSTKSSNDSYNVYSKKSTECGVASVITIDSDTSSVASGLTTFTSVFWGSSKANLANKQRKKDKDLVFRAIPKSRQSC